VWGEFNLENRLRFMLAEAVLAGFFGRII